MNERKSHRGSRITLAVLAVLLGGVIYGLHWFVSIDDLAGCEKQPAGSACAPADAIVVISGGDTRARTHEAVELYKQGWAPMLIVSGAAKDKSGPSNAEAMRQHAVSLGVPLGVVVIDTQAQNTNQNASGANRLAKQRGVRSIIVVTSPYHLARTKLLFEREFAETGAVRAHPSKGDNNWSRHWWLSVNGWRLVGSELVKYTVQLTRGSIQQDV